MKHENPRTRSLLCHSLRRFALLTNDIAKKVIKISMFGERMGHEKRMARVLVTAERLTFNWAEIRSKNFISKTSKN